MVADLIRPELAGLEPYVPIHPFEVVSRRLGRPPDRIVKLDANENPYGPSPRAIEAVATYGWHHIYPDPQSTELREALAGFLGVPAECILAGHGADELIDLLGRLFLAPGDVVVDCPPTFGMYAFDAAINGAGVKRVARLEDFSLDLMGVEQAVQASHGSLAAEAPGEGSAPDGSSGAAQSRPKLLFVCSPNNPDGGLVGPKDLQRLLQLPVVVVVDEAYIEFAGMESSCVAWVKDYANLVVLRTFSKWAGLGGLRVGYGVFPPGIIRQLWKIKQPYNVNVAGTRAALASLADREYLLANVARIRAERDRLYEALARLPFLQPHPGSQSNFILCRVIGRPARQLKLDLERDGVLVRYFAKPGLENCIRISVGRPEDSATLLAALERLDP
jgi:histidinol-phosphate aminotransferase